MSCQRVNYVPSECHRVHAKPHLLYKRAYIAVAPSLLATPRHEYIYIDRRSWHFSFAVVSVAHGNVSITLDMYIFYLFVAPGRAYLQFLSTVRYQI